MELFIRDCVKPRGCSRNECGTGGRLRRIDDFGESGELKDYSLFHAARADIPRRLDRPAEAAGAYYRALALTTNHVERDFLQHRLLWLSASRQSTVR